MMMSPVVTSLVVLRPFRHSACLTGQFAGARFPAVECCPSKLITKTSLILLLVTLIAVGSVVPATQLGRPRNAILHFLFLFVQETPFDMVKTPSLPPINQIPTNRPSTGWLHTHFWNLDQSNYFGHEMKGRTHIDP
jgi:hypothetical protein